jgi:hypothetical protein
VQPGQPRPGGAQEPQLGAGEQKPDEPGPGEQGAPGARPEQRPGVEGQEPQKGGRGAAPDQPPDAKGMERIARELQKAARQGRQPELTREQAERAREMARKLSERMTPEQRDELQRLAREMQNPLPGEGGGPGSKPARPRMASRPADPRAAATEPVDARRAPQEKPSERVIAEWYSDKPIQRDGTAPAPTPAEAMREAAASADRAVEKQEVPARYSDMVRRVFKRYSDQAPRR